VGRKLVKDGKSDRMLPIDGDLLKAVILDVDGTMYRQGPVRRAMFWRLLRACIGHPAQGVKTLRALRAYRKAQDVLRIAGWGEGDLAETHCRLAAEWTGLDRERVRASVTRWMKQEPLGLLRGSARKGLHEFLQAAQGCGVRLGVFSDYPAARKLDAMGIAGFFDVVVCATDPGIQCFKPHPRGLAVVLERLGVEPSCALYIGDRGEVDGAAADAAGIPCVLLGQRPAVANGAGWIAMSGYPELRQAIFGRIDGSRPSWGVCTGPLSSRAPHDGTGGRPSPRSGSSSGASNQGIGHPC